MVPPEMKRKIDELRDKEISEFIISKIKRTRLFESHSLYSDFTYGTERNRAEDSKGGS